MLFIDGKFHYTDGVPKRAIMDKFIERNDRHVPCEKQAVCIAIVYV